MSTSFLPLHPGPALTLLVQVPHLPLANARGLSVGTRRARAGVHIPLRPGRARGQPPEPGRQHHSTPCGHWQDSLSPLPSCDGTSLLSEQAALHAHVTLCANVAAQLCYRDGETEHVETATPEMALSVTWARKMGCVLLPPRGEHCRTGRGEKSQKESFLRSPDLPSSGRGYRG